MRSHWSFSMRQRKMLITFYAQSRQHPPDENDPLAVFPEDIVSTHWVPKEIRLDDERTLVLDPS